MKKPELSKTAIIVLASIIIVLGLGLLGTSLFFQYGDLKFTKAIIYTLNITSTISLFVGAGLLYTALKKEGQGHKLSTREITMIGVMSGLTVVLYYFVKFNLPFFPPWLDIQISELPALITTFAYGPYAGCIVIIVRFIVKLPASITAGVGEAADLALGLTLCIITGLFYKRNRTIKGALIGISIGVGVSTVMACFLNWLVLIPAYINLAHFPKEALIGMLKYMGNVNESNFMLMYVLVGVLPFNLFRYIIVSILTFILYKKTHQVLIKINTMSRQTNHRPTNNTTDTSEVEKEKHE